MKRECPKPGANVSLAIFFEGTGQGVYGRKTNVSLVFEACVADAARAWVVKPAVERGLRLREGAVPVIRAASKSAVRHDSRRHVSNLFGLIKPLRRVFPAGMRRFYDIIPNPGMKVP